jgi:hypothetical protein
MRSSRVVGAVALALVFLASSGLVGDHLPGVGGSTSTPAAYSSHTDLLSVVGGEPARPIRPAGALQITSFTAAPSTVVKSSPVWLNVTAVGGAPPYTYSYHDLPPGYACRSSNASGIVCYTSDVAKFTIGVTVNDTAGASVNASTNLTVTTGYGGPPIISSFYADPSPIAVGQKTLVIVNATSGSTTPTVNLGYAFYGLPPGCASFNQSVLSCIPSQAGSYDVKVQVTDGFGDFRITNMTLVVTGGAASTSGTAIPLGGAAVYVVVVLVLVVLLAGATILLRGRRRHRGPGAPQRWESPPNPTAGSGGSPRDPNSE